MVEEKSMVQQIRTVWISVKIWQIKYFTPDKYLFVIVVNGNPVKAIEVG